MTELSPQLPGENKWKSALIGGIAGAIGTTVVGLVFSSTTLSFIASLFGQNSLPPLAVVFVSGSDCGKVGNGWRKFEHAEGRFLVGAGKNADHPEKSFQSDITNPGAVAIKIEEKNLPDFRISVPMTTGGIGIGGGGNYGVVNEIAGKTSNLTRTLDYKGASVAVDTLPPWIALTACQKQP